MSNYTKFTLDTIRMKLKAGEYESLVGVNRAIGKTKDLSAEDKVKAKALAAKHFGVEVPAAKPAKAAKAAKQAKGPKAPKAAPRSKKAVKKAEAKPVTKKGAKKTKRKAGKRAPRATEEAAPAPAGETAPVAASEFKAKTGGAKRIAPKLVEGEAPVYGESATSVIRDMGNTITTIDNALKSMETAKRLFPKAELEKGVELAVTAMGRAVSVLDEAVISPLLQEAPQKVTAARGKRGKAASSAPPAPEAEAPVAEAAVAEHTETQASEPAESPPAPEEAFDEENLTEDEKAQVAFGRATRPAIFRGQSPHSST